MSNFTKLFEDRLASIACGLTGGLMSMYPFDSVYADIESLTK